MAAIAAVAVFLGLLSVATCEPSDQGVILRNCMNKYNLSEEKSKQLLDTFFELKDVSAMEDVIKQVYLCLLTDMGLVDDKKCVKWEKVCEWYESELPEKIRKEYMDKHKKDIMACDKGCKATGNSDDLVEMLNATACVFDLMRKVQ